MRTRKLRYEAARCHLPWLWGLACRLIDDDGAEALVRDCLERAMGDDAPAGDERAWLLRHLLGCLTDRPPRGGIDPVNRQLTEPRDPVVTASAVATLRAAGHRQPRVLLDRLPPPARVAVALVHGEGVTASRVAEVFRVPISRVHAWLDLGQLLLAQPAQRPLGQPR